MRLLLILFSILFVNSVIAEPKQLICESNPEEAVKRWEEKAQDPWYQKHMKDFISGYLAQAESCRKSSFGARVTVIFDTDGLTLSEKSKAEMGSTTCWSGDNAVEAVEMSATPSVISFTDESSSFNVDRKNLSAGFGVTRNYRCKIEDIDTSENLI